MSTTEKRWPAPEAHLVATLLVMALEPFCERIEIAGSLRRWKPDVGDIELLYIPKLATEPDLTDFFAPPRPVNLADRAIAGLESQRKLAKRPNALGRFTFGALNKLMLHIPSGIPVDLFSTDDACWHNYLVCRTGPADLNTRICNAAIARGEHWMPYGGGFRRADGSIAEMPSERAVFVHVGLPYLEPSLRQ